MSECSPWIDEPDRDEWKHRGLPCVMARAQTTGAWCGYVAVPPGHPLHGVDLAGGSDADEAAELSVHGGITYSASCSGPVCHEPAPGEPDNVWWLGFDCAHAGDYLPAIDLGFIPEAPRGATRGDPMGQADRYRDMSYVREEVESLAEQLADLGGGHG